MSKERWIVRELKPGDMIRVYTGSFYHVGIYIGNTDVIHFAGPDPNTLTDPASARIRQSPLDDFAGKGQIEVRAFRFFERLKKRQPDAVIAEARRHLGEGSYDIIHNNCEHFANLCVFGLAFSAQINEMRANLP